MTFKLGGLGLTAYCAIYSDNGPWPEVAAVTPVSTVTVLYTPLPNLE